MFGRRQRQQEHGAFGVAISKRAYTSLLKFLALNSFERLTTIEVDNLTI